MRKLSLFALIFTISSAPFMTETLCAADITISEMEFITRGNWSDQAESVVLTTRGMSTMEVGGGYKFGGSMSFGFESGNIDYAGDDPPNYLDEEYQSQSSPARQDSYLQDLSLYNQNRTTLDFLGAEVVYRGIGSEGTNLTYFVGENDRIASGEDFVEHFGTLPFETKYKGYFYFPEQDYRGLHRVDGTGLKVDTDLGSSWHRSSLYLYQDAHTGMDPGTYSSDYRAQFHSDKINFEYFAGATFPRDEYGLYRTGMLFHYQPSERGEFFAQVGIPWWEPLNRLTIEHFYFLFEPRVHFYPLSIILTLFWHPEYYQMQQTDDLGTTDIHVNFLFGKPNEDPVTGGLETTLQLNTEQINKDYEFITTPYLQAATGGVIWNFSVNFTLLPYAHDTLVEGVVGIKAEF
jgi:hypothetical protein